MLNPDRLRIEAQHIPIEERKRILAAIPEVEIHHALAELFRVMSPDAWVEVTHGTEEFGKDLVIVRCDPLLPDVIGVVVKRGDVRGKTAGDVDRLRGEVEEVLTAKGERITNEILSQIRQAKLHGAQLKYHLHELAVDSVMVVLVGQLSGNARRRLEAEVESLAGVKDLPWLVEAFTNFYPQVFFEARALDYLYEVIEHLDQDSFHAKSGKTLSECYVDPVLVPMDTEISYDDASNLASVKRRRVTFAALANQLTPRRRVIVVGDPGSGKSKVVAKYCIDRCREALNQMTRVGEEVKVVGIPLVTQARRLMSCDTSSDLLNELLPHSVRERLGTSMLVVDGLDELPAEQRQPMLDKAGSFASSLAVPLIVTSRRLAVITTAPQGFQRYEILPFEFGQAMKLVNKVLISKDVMPALRMGIEKIQDQLPMNPLSLILLIEVVAERKEVPASLTELYERFLDLVFGRWDKEKGLEVLFEYVVKKRFLAALAYTQFFEKNRLEVAASDFEQFLAEYAKTYGWDAEQLRGFVKEIERAGVLEMQADVLFRHRSFLDFFVAQYLSEQRDRIPELVKLVANTYHNEVWSEAAFFYTGLNREITADVVEAVFGYQDGNPDLPLQKLLAGRLLQAGWHSPTAVKARGLSLALESLPAAVERAQHWMQVLKRGSPTLLGELMALALAKHSVGSFALASEAKERLDHLSREQARTREAFHQRAALLWALERHLPPEEHGVALKKFLADITDAKLDTLEEARLLLIAGLADPAADVRKLIGRRIRRIEAETPNAIAMLVPGKKPRFKPPRTRRR